MERLHQVLPRLITVAAYTMLAVLAIFGALPWLVVAWCVLLSVVAIVVYGRDKRAAVEHRRRTPESTLHLISLLGGWPGALTARHAFRHKTVKQPFRLIFWLTVVLNCAAIAALAWWYGGR
jgi:uncharacterized membrane protein YsdA (DUF1294 family)